MYSLVLLNYSDRCLQLLVRDLDRLVNNGKHSLDHLLHYVYAIFCVIFH